MWAEVIAEFIFGLFDGWEWRGRRLRRKGRR